MQEADPVACAGTRIPQVEANVRKLVKRLRKAAGRKVRIVGTIQADVLLSLWVTGQQSDRDLPSLSVVAFRSLLNPALKRAY